MTTTHATTDGGGRRDRRSRPWPVLVVSGALVVIGAGVYGLGSSLDADAVERLGGNPPINAGARDLADIRANNSPSVVVSPTNTNNLAVVNRVDQPVFGCRLHASLDGGANWFETDIPFPEGEEAPPRCFAADAAFTADGDLVVSFVTLKGQGNVPNAAWVVGSSDGGRSLSPPVKAAGPLAFQLRVAADPRRAERLYLTYVQGAAVASLAFPGTDNPVSILRSDDGGATWQGPVTVTPPARARVVAPSAAVGPGGEVYVLYLDVGDDSLDYHGAHQGRGGEPYPGRWSLVLARSADGGATWQEAPVDEKVVPAHRFIVFFPPSPSLAVDQRSGRVYAAFHDQRLGDPDVWVWASGDGGRNFDEPRRVNDTAPGDGSAQYLPRLSVAPTGRLDVVYYDRRADPDDVMNEVSLQASFDGGRTFGTRGLVSTRAFDSRIGFGAERGMPELGSRIGLVSSKRRALAVWADTRAGTEASNKQDLAGGVVELTEGSAVRSPLRVAGIAAASLGALAVALARRRRKPSGRTGQPVGTTLETVASTSALPDATTGARLMGAGVGLAARHRGPARAAVRPCWVVVLFAAVLLGAGQGRAAGQETPPPPPPPSFPEPPTSAPATTTPPATPAPTSPPTTQAPVVQARRARTQPTAPPVAVTSSPTTAVPTTGPAETPLTPTSLVPDPSTTPAAPADDDPPAWLLVLAGAALGAVAVLLVGAVRRRGSSRRRSPSRGWPVPASPR